MRDCIAAALRQDKTRVGVGVGVGVCVGGWVGVGKTSQGSEFKSTTCLRGNSAQKCCAIIIAS